MYDLYAAGKMNSVPVSPPGSETFFAISARIAFLFDEFGLSQMNLIVVKGCILYKKCYCYKNAGLMLHRSKYFYNLL